MVSVKLAKQNQQGAPGYEGMANKFHEEQKLKEQAKQNKQKMAVY
jgi:hypothetical protein